MLLSAEFIGFAKKIAEMWPHYYAQSYPHQIIPPSQNYANPRIYAASLASILHLGRDTDYNTRNPIVGGINFCGERLVELKVPTFFIGSDFLRAVSQTDIDPNFEFENLHWPFEAMLFCLPVDVMRELFPVPVPWLSIAKIPKGERKIGVHYKVDLKEDRAAFHFPVFADSACPSDFGGMYPTKGTLKEYLTTKPFFSDPLVFNERETAGLKSLSEEMDKEISYKATVLAVQITLGMLSRPDMVQIGREIRKAKINPHRPEKSYDALWDGNTVGFRYREIAKREIAAEIGVSRRFRARRGHFRNQIYGRMYDVDGQPIPAEKRPHKSIWIFPIDEE